MAFLETLSMALKAILSSPLCKRGNWDGGGNTRPGLRGQWLAKLGVESKQSKSRARVLVPGPLSGRLAPTLTGGSVPSPLGAAKSLRPQRACAPAEKSTGRYGRSWASTWIMRDSPTGSEAPVFLWTKPQTSFSSCPGGVPRASSLPRTGRREQRPVDPQLCLSWDKRHTAGSTSADGVDAPSAWMRDASGPRVSAYHWEQYPTRQICTVNRNFD